MSDAEILEQLREITNLLASLVAANPVARHAYDEVLAHDKAHRASR